MRKQPQVTEQTRSNFMSAFWELYLAKPIEKITVREIAERAGYNRATFYLYFRDVYDLFEQLEASVLGQIEQLVTERLLSSDTLDLSQHMGVIVRMARRFNDVLPRLLAGDPAFGERLKAIIAPLLDRFILTDPDLTAQEQAVLREFYLSGLLSAIGLWLQDPDAMPIGRLIDLIIAATIGRDGSAPARGQGASAQRPAAARNRGI